MGWAASSSYEVTSRSTARCRPENRQITPTTRGQSHSGSGLPGGTNTLTVSINRGAEDLVVLPDSDFCGALDKKDAEGDDVQACESFAVGIRRRGQAYESGERLSAFRSSKALPAQRGPPTRALVHHSP